MRARLIEIVELMKQGARRVLVRKNITEACTVDKKPFAPFYKAELKITGTPRAAAAAGGGAARAGAAGEREEKRVKLRSRQRSNRGCALGGGFNATTPAGFNADP